MFFKVLILFLVNQINSNLIEYSTFQRDCDDLIRRENIKGHCQDKASRDWSSSSSASNYAKVQCCEMWDVNDCILEEIKSRCDYSVYKEVKDQMNSRQQQMSANICYDYPYGSYNCHFPIWLIIVIVVGGVALLLIGCFIGMMIYSKHQASKIGHF